MLAQSTEKGHFVTNRVCLSLLEFFPCRQLYSSRDRGNLNSNCSAKSSLVLSKGHFRISIEEERKKIAFNIGRLAPIESFS